MVERRSPKPRPRGFESLHRCQGPVAQLVEQLTFNQLVVRSNRTGFTKYLGIAQPGSALVLGTRGRWFESSYRDHIGELAESGLMQRS